MLSCDFCGDDGDASWSYPCAPTSVSLLAGVEVQLGPHWHICEACAELIERNEYNKLAQRFAQCSAVRNDLRKYGEGPLLAHGLKMVRAFRQARRGPRTSLHVVVVCRSATDPLNPKVAGSKRGYQCKNCGAEVEASIDGQAQIARGGIPLCNPCGLRFSEAVLERDHSLEFCLSREAVNAYERMKLRERRN